MKNEMYEDKLEQTSENKKNRKVLKVLGLLFLLILNVAIGSEVLRTRIWNPNPIVLGSYSAPSLQEIEFKNMLSSIIKTVVSVIYMIYIFTCFIYFIFSKKTSHEKKRKIILWLSNCLVISLLLFCGLNYFFILKYELTGGNIVI